MDAAERLQQMVDEVLSGDYAALKRRADRFSDFAQRVDLATPSGPEDLSVLQDLNGPDDVQARPGER